MTNMRQYEQDEQDEQYSQYIVSIKSTREEQEGIVQVALLSALVFTSVCKDATSIYQKGKG